MRTFFRFLMWAIATIIIIPTCLFTKRFLPNFKYIPPMYYHKVLCWIMGVKIEIKGEKSKDNPTLFVSNHLGYLDIPVLGSLIKGSFVSKGEVASWPVIGFLATLQNTIFVRKQKRSEAGKQANMIVSSIRKGNSIIVFPEGTSWYGNETLPFKSSLFSVAMEKVSYNNEKEQFMKVQPVSVCFVELEEGVVGFNERKYYSWVGDEEMFPHLPKFFSLGNKKIVVEFHPVVSMDQFKNRKEIAAYCQSVVAKGVSDKISGRY
ncbi:MAG: 1-acyl-sn-glycerol-3-phosphate acyltransferase [Alphaproteobacteria bacterium]|nr:1-acyl-sn-glycerol-3-phosphate acyltransferase [Alphaproteobacteria bacterium]